MSPSKIVFVILTLAAGMFSASAVVHAEEPLPEPLLFSFNIADTGSVFDPVTGKTTFTVVSNRFANLALAAGGVTSGVEGEVEGSLTGKPRRASETTTVTDAGPLTVTTVGRGESRSATALTGSVLINLVGADPAGGTPFTVKFVVTGRSTQRLTIEVVLTNNDTGETQTTRSDELTIPVTVAQFCPPPGQTCFDGFGTLTRRIFDNTFAETRTDKLDARLISDTGVFVLTLLRADTTF